MNKSMELNLDSETETELNKLLKDVRDTGRGVWDTYQLGVRHFDREFRQNLGSSLKGPAAGIFSISLRNKNETAIAFFGVNFVKDEYLRNFENLDLPIISSDSNTTVRIKELISVGNFPFRFPDKEKCPGITLSSQVAIFHTEESVEDGHRLFELMDDEVFLRNELKFPLINDLPVLEISLMNNMIPLPERPLAMNQWEQILFTGFNKYIV